LLDELVIGARRVEPPPQPERRREGGERDRQGNITHERLAIVTIAAPAREQHQQRPGQGQKDD
jgi:hypothetical protein